MRSGILSAVAAIAAGLFGAGVTSIFGTKSTSSETRATPRTVAFSASFCSFSAR